MKERCIYCGGDIYYQESMQLVKCDWCGQTMVVAKFENELARRKKTEEENAQIKEKLAQTEKEKQAADDRLFAALSNLDSIENAQGDTLALLQALRSEAAGDADVLSSMLCTLLSGQKDADSQLQLLQTVSDRILGSQNDALAKIQAQSEIISKLYAMEMDAGKRQQLANDFMIWMQNIQKEDTAKLQQIGKASGALLQEQRRIGDNVEKLRQEAADIQQSIRNFEGKWEDARLQEIQQLYHQAWSFQSDRRFDKADEYYRRVLVKGGEDPDVYWRLLMCHYCLTYQKDEEGKAIPIILNPDLTDPEEMSLRRDLLQHISGQEERYYQGELAKIDRILDKYRLVKDQSSYDVFISVKQNKDGRLTIDSDKASDLYDFLTREGLRVFNSRRCDLPAGQEYEPYIISALMSAKVLIVVGSSAENMNAQWVKNEWSRFQWLQKKEIEKNGKTDRLLLCYLIRGMQPGQIPRALNPSLQAICEDVNASSRLLKALRPVLQEKKTSRVQDHDYNRSMKKHEKTEEPRQIEAETVSLEEVLDEMMVCLLTGDFETVTSRYAKIKTVKPYMYAPQLHLYALCALHQAEDMDQLVQSPVDLGKEGLFKLAMRFSKGKELEKKLQYYLEVNQGRKKADSKVRKEESKPAQAEKTMIPVTGKEPRLLVTAEDWYEKGKEEILTDDRTGAFADFQKAAQMGHPMAMIGLGFMYYSAYGIRFDDAEADKWIKKGLDGDSSLLKKDIDWYLKAAENGCLQIQAQLGYMYEMRIGVDADRDKEKFWYQEAAGRGHAYAQIRLGYCLRTGRPADIDHDAAFRCFLKAAEQGHPQGQFEVSFCYSIGRGVSKNETESFVWLKKAADQGYGPALNNMGSRYENGKGVSKDPSMAVKYYRMAAEKGRAQALCNLGRCYEKGFGVGRDFQEAARLYKKAAETDNFLSGLHDTAEASYVRVTQGAQKCYEKGMQLKGDPEGSAYRTTTWLKAAAEGDHAPACEELAGIYQNGFKQGYTYVRNNPEESEKWRKRAEELREASLTAKSQTQRASSDMPELVKETALLLTPNDHMLVLEQEGYEEKDTFAEVYPAMRVDRGFLKSGLEQNRAEEIVLRNPYILLTDDHLDIFSAQKLLNDVEAAGRDLLLIAEEENGLPAAILSDPKNKVKIAVVKPASYGDRKIEILRDLAVFTNGTAIITKDGMSLEKTNRNMLESKMGSATTVIVRQQETFIINANRKEALVTKRVDEIKAAIAKSYSDFDKEKMTERLHNLQGRAVVFWVSGRTEARKKVKREDLEDCIKAYQEKQRAEEEKKKSEKAYSEGLQLVLKKEYAKAFPLFKQAAEEGHAGAQHQLGKLYMEGNGVKRSPQEAIKWYRKAAEAGDKDAQYWLGYYYQSGCEGLHKNLEEARRWFKMSADQGGAGAKYALEKVEAQLQTRRTCPVCGCVSENRNTTICPVCGSNMK